MVHTLTKPETETLLLELPRTLKLYVTQEQFTALAASNRELRLERTAKAELIVNPLTGWETGKGNFSIIGQLHRRYEDYQQGEAFDF